MTPLIPILALVAVAVLAIVFFNKTNAVVAAVNQRLDAVAVLSQRMDSALVTLTKTDTTADVLAQTASGIREELSRAKETLVSLQVYSQSRQDIERQAADSIKRVENILAGAGTKGSAGENIVELAFSNLPSDWQVRNLAVANKIVEFGVRLPDNLILPIDSKWAATDLLEQFIACSNPDEKCKLKTRIHTVTENRATEIQKYLDPNITTPFGLVVVPDPLFEICSEIVPALSQQNAILVSYSMFIPYSLLIFHMTLRSAHTIDLRRLDAFVKSVNESVTSLQELLQGRFSKTVVMLNNLRTEMEAQLGKLNTSVAALHILETGTAVSAGQS